MTRRARTSPRKQPRQVRSRATVDAIVAATARVLVQDGYDALSTNRVAREAGLSVGSLYQYFPGKEALVAAVMERYAERLQENVAARLAGIAPDAGPEEVATELIRAMLAAYQEEPRLHRALVEQVPRIGALKRAHELQAGYQGLVTAWMDAHADRVEVADREVASFVLVAAVEGLINRGLLDRPDLVTSGAIEQHILRLVIAYVNPGVAAEASGAGRLAGRPRHRERSA